MNERNDKRRISRADWNLGCSLVHNETSHDCHIRNFSLTGLLIETREPVAFQPGDDILIRISILGPENESSRIHCEVVRCGRKYAGVKFTAMDFDTLMRLKDHLCEIMQDDDKLDKEIIRLIRENAGLDDSGQGNDR